MGRRPPPKDVSVRSPWQEGTDVHGVVPPGRRLSPPTERRPNAWSASGVKGVTPPGNARPETSPSAEWVRENIARKVRAERTNIRALRARQKGFGEAVVQTPRPSAGVQPDPFADVRDPESMRAYLQVIHQFLEEQPVPEDAPESLAQLITQSHAPYEIVLAFTLLSAAVGRDPDRRRDFSHALERGAKVFFNLVQRLDEPVTPPDELRPETMDAIFYDLPDTALQLPYAFASDAFAQMADLLREPGNSDRDRALVTFLKQLRVAHIEGRSFGDQALETMFPWELPRWGKELHENGETYHPLRRLPIKS